MKSSLSPAVPFLLLFGAAFLFTASGARADTKLEASMKEMGGAYKELSTDLKQPQDANKDQYLALAAKIKETAKASHDLAPKLAQTLPPDQRDVMIQSYQKDMDKFVTDIDSLSAALKDSKWDDARKLMTALHDDMASGHKQYRAHKDKSAQPGQPSTAQPGATPQTQSPAPAQPTPPPAQ